MKWSNVSFRKRVADYQSDGDWVIFAWTINTFSSRLFISNNFKSKRWFESTRCCRFSCRVPVVFACYPVIKTELRSQWQVLYVVSDELKSNSETWLNWLALPLLLSVTKKAFVCSPLWLIAKANARGGDNQKALILGESYVSTAKGSLGFCPW